MTGPTMGPGKNSGQIYGVPFSRTPPTDDQVLKYDEDTEELRFEDDLTLTYEAQSVLAAVLANTPVAVTMAEQTILGRKTGGNIAALTASEVKTLLAIAEADVANLTTDLAAKAAKTHYAYLYIHAKDFLVPAAEAGYWDTEVLSNGFPMVRMAFPKAATHTCYAEVTWPTNCDGTTHLGISVICTTAVYSTQYAVVKIDARSSSDSSSMSAVITDNVGSIIVHANGDAYDVRQTVLGDIYSVPGFGGRTIFKITRDIASGDDTMTTDLLLLGILIRYKVTELA